MSTKARLRKMFVKSDKSRKAFEKQYGPIEAPNESYYVARKELFEAWKAGARWQKLRYKKRRKAGG